MNLDHILDAAARILPARAAAKLISLTARQRAAALVLLGIAGGFLGLLIALGIAPWAVTGVLASLQERATFPMLQAQIEQVRADSKAVRCDVENAAFAPVVALVEQWNTRIAHEREANKHWYSDLFSTDRWNAVERIVLPCQSQNAGHQQ